MDQGQDGDLPPTKIQRKYFCKLCPDVTTNPREHLEHLRDVHQLKVKIVKCPLCVYACQYRQKLSRHLKLIHKIPPQPNAEHSVTEDDNSDSQNNLPDLDLSSLNLSQEFLANQQQVMMMLNQETSPDLYASQNQLQQALSLLQPISSAFLNNEGESLVEQEEPLNLSIPEDVKITIRNCASIFQQELERLWLRNHASCLQ